MARARGTCPVQTAMTPEQFIAKYRGVQLNEVALYVSHFNDLCALVGHPQPVEMDRVGETFTFQKGALKPPLSAAESGGEELGVRRRGFADVWFRGHFAFEYKTPGKHKDLREAYRQLQLYRESLENPYLLVVCDVTRYEVHTNFPNTVTKTFAFTHEDIARNTPLAGERFSAAQILRHLFFDPEALRPEKTTEAVTQDAARQFAALADSMHKHKVAPVQAARFLVKLVFCLFCEDVGLLPKDLFTRIVDSTKAQPREFVRHMRDLFGAMAEGGRIMWGERIAHFDGGLFRHAEADPDVVEFDGEDLLRLAKAAQLNWADTDPSIFGTLFERALDVEGKRAQLGAHYTSRADIETLVEPVLMAPLRREWEEVKARTADYLDWHLTPASGTPSPDANFSVGRGARGEGKRAALEKLLRDFQQTLVDTTVLDPACGSGNFLYVSLNLLKDLEKQVITFGLSVGITDLEPRVTPAQLRGIEKDDFAYQLASIVVWIGYLQWKARNGYSPAGETPILKPLDTIQQMDAILEVAESSPSPQLSPSGRGGGPRKNRDHPPFSQREKGAGGMRAISEPTWPAATVIVGNPPFLGGKRMRTELGDFYVDALFELYDGRVPREVDLVCYWFEKARAMIEAGNVKRTGLLATSSIRGGASRKVLERIKKTGGIFWAWSEREWILDGAAVEVSMIGFDDGEEKSHLLGGRPVIKINSDLTASTDLTQAKRLQENLNLSFMGVTPAGEFDIPESVARYWMTMPPNPNGRSNSDVLRSYYNGIDLTRRPRNVWIVDFGVNIPEEEAALYEAPFQHLVHKVKPERAKNNRAAYRDKWWLFAEARPAMREALKPLDRYIGTSMVSKHFFFCWIPNEVLPANLLIVVARDDDYFFGSLQSRIHEVWALRQGTSLEDRPRYTPTTTFETFPFPWPPGKEPKRDPRVKAIAEAARELNEKRESWLNPYKDEPSALRADLFKLTLTNLYNKRPEWLRLAHEKLDRAVLDAYGWPHTLSDDEILARLLDENLKREAAGKAEPLKH